MDAIVTWMIVGGIAGLLAQWLVGGVAVGCIGTVVIGILGAFIGGWLFDLLNFSIGTGLVNKFIAAFFGAAVLLVMCACCEGSNERRCEERAPQGCLQSGPLLALMCG